MKIQSYLKLVLGAATLGLALAPVAHAQNARFVGYETNAGLLGQTYTGAEFSYLHRADGPPRTLHRFGFVSTTLLPELHNVDGAFRYSYTRGNAFDTMLHRHDVAASFTHFLPLGDVKPFVRGDIGMAWTKAGDVRERSIAYLLGVGAEFLVAPRVALTPTAYYQEASRLHERNWNFGVNATRRFNREWSGTFGIAFDDERNIDFHLGGQRRF